VRRRHGPTFGWHRGFLLGRDRSAGADDPSRIVQCGGAIFAPDQSPARPGQRDAGRTAPAQLAYAADDVHHLLQLHTEFTAALTAQGRIEWLREDCAALEDPALYRTEPADAWRRLKGLGRLRPQEQSVARALAAWREQRAIASDKPRGWILTDDALYALATLAPSSTADLEKVPALPPAVIRNRGEELLALIASTRVSSDDSNAVPTPQRLTPEQTRLIGRLQQQVRDVATQLGISPEVLATRRDIETLALGSRESSPLMNGWRRSVIGEQLLQLIA